MHESPLSCEFPPAVAPGVVVGTRAPDFAFRDAEGRSRTLSSLRGRPAIVAFLSSRWDPAHAQWRSVYNDLLDRTGGGSVVSLSRDDVACEISTGDESVPFSIAEGGDRDAARRYGVEGRQACFLVDAQGIVRWRHLSPIGAQPDLDELAATLNALAGPHTVSRREFLLTALAVSLVTASPPRIARAAPARATGASAATGERNVTLNVNGHAVSVSVEPRVTLLDALRERIGLIGTKKGCDHGQCGACTVHVDGRRINSCLMLAVQAEGRKITTIEGLAQGDTLHPVQAAFIKHDGFQCGYCTSGQIMSAVACLREGHARTREEIAEWMSGNICRCGAYPGICAAIEEARDRSTGRA
jgi:xanthine dehydrogenase YagT iron-sulfur-binding subunit